MMVPFNVVSFGVTFIIIMWILSDPENNTRMFLGIPSIAVLMFSYIVLGTNWAVFGQEFENLRLFFAGIVAIPYVVSSGAAFFIRVYSYMLAQATAPKARNSSSGRGGIRIEDLLLKKK